MSRLLAGRPRDSPHPRGWTVGGRQVVRRDLGFPAPAGMDPVRPVPPRGALRIPRTRGDGPFSSTVEAWTTPDSPHPRGWTRPGPGRRHRRRGFPAPAGMDLTETDRRPFAEGIPRTRGDGPPNTHPEASIAADSPHPRGWTRDQRFGNLRDDGFPAPAGMDRRRRRRRNCRPRIPRTRGDGPMMQVSVQLPAEDSPHPRGWTHMLPGAPVQRRGFPAPAGMDPGGRGWSARAAGIPRTRGDGPGSGWGGPEIVEDSPHPRGWTRVSAVRGGHVGGFPAPAGMDRRAAQSGGGRRGIPRTRGDGPEPLTGATVHAVDSPHPRGWTLSTAVASDLPSGFPAPAGMDRQVEAVRPRIRRIPRTRGDGPGGTGDWGAAHADSPHPRGWTGALRESMPAEYGFPAPAGMDPADTTRRATTRRIPRTRGDGPVVWCWRMVEVLDSPHPRGWTGVRAVCGWPGRGFPAPAGMDPRQGLPGSRPAWIPRTRGDGPRQAAADAEEHMDSPHPRGWTLTTMTDKCALCGFPAPAGMDPGTG